MAHTFESSLSALAGTRVTVSPDDIPRDAGEAPVLISFSTGAVVTAIYWRMIENGRASISSFDHEQQYGLPAPINAIQMLCDALADKEVTSASLDHSTGDLLFSFAASVIVQVFNFTGYEIWNIRFADGAVEYSNYNK